MEIKGSAIISIQDFVKNKYNERFNEWLNSLSESSRKIMSGKILSSDWYPLNEGITEPTKKICDLFFNGDKKGAWEAGRYSADHGLKGIYKVFVRLGSPSFILQKASLILPTYYNPCEMKTVLVERKKSILQITLFPELNVYLENRIGGWIERALEITGCRDLKVKIARSLIKGDPVTEYISGWS